jgi:hypothetical protein
MTCRPPARGVNTNICSLSSYVAEGLKPGFAIVFAVVFDN